jgi:hypothetical protein
MTGKKSSSNAGFGEVRALGSDAFDNLLQGSPSAEQVCEELARVFMVTSSEVALYRLEKGFLRFLFPVALKSAGVIPLTSSAAVSAHTASSKKAELFNTFAKVKHASVFEHIKLSATQEQESVQIPIQKLISAPVLDKDGDVLGVIQVCRKGQDPSCGPDFSLENLRLLELAAKALAHASFMQPAGE